LCDGKKADDIMVGTPGINFGDLLLTNAGDHFLTSLLTAAQKARFTYIYGLGGSDTMVINTLAYLPSIMTGDGGNDLMKITVTLPTLPGDHGIEFSGGDGSDTLFGSTSGDILAGDTGTDRILGGGGTDYITGGAAADRLTGGSGSDRFIYDTFDYYKRGATIYVTGNMGRDHITDFNPSGTKADKIKMQLGLMYRDLDITQVGDDVIIKAHKEDIAVFLNGGTALVDFSATIVLEHVDIADIGRGDFIL
jgi:Ca2+-binding RTX toxin-like protein